MRYLLDTRTLLCWAFDPLKLSDDARVAIGNGRSHVFVSAVSAFQIAAMRQSGKLQTPPTLGKLLAENRFVELAIDFRHASAIEDLPLIHKDPLDRLLIAQARVEKLTLITRDTEILKYDVPTIAA